MRLDRMVSSQILVNEPDSRTKRGSCPRPDEGASQRFLVQSARGAPCLTIGGTWAPEHGLDPGFSAVDLE